MTVAGLRRASDYEEYVGGCTIRIFEGHPRYCPEQTLHMPHEFGYRYLDGRGLPCRGEYLCDGRPMTFATREK